MGGVSTDGMEGLFFGMDIAASGMTAELRRSEIVAANIANMHVTGGRGREPYRRRGVVFEEALANASQQWPDTPGASRVAGGVQVARVFEDRDAPFVARYEPGHPDADERGFVLGSNVDLFREMVDMSVIERSFAANLAAMRAYRTMLRNSITNIGRA